MSTAGFSGGDDPVGRLAAVLDTLDHHLQASDAVANREQTNRLSMLHVHAAAAVLLGPTFAAVGIAGMTGSTWTLVRMIPGAPFSLAVVIFAGGLILGTATWFRNIKWEIVGLWLLLSWYATIGTSFGGALLLWLLAGMPHGVARPSPYAMIPYYHFAVIMAVHLATLHRILRSRRATP